MPHDDGGRREERFIGVYDCCYVQRVLGQIPHRDLRGPQEEAGAHHDDNAPVDRPVVELLDIAEPIEPGPVTAPSDEARQIPEQVEHVFRPREQGFQFCSPLARERDVPHVEHAHRDQQRGCPAVGQCLHGDSPDPPEEGLGPGRLGIAQREAGDDQDERTHEEAGVLHAEYSGEALMLPFLRRRGGARFPLCERRSQTATGLRHHIGCDVALRLRDGPPVGVLFQPPALCAEPALQLRQEARPLHPARRRVFGPMLVVRPPRAHLQLRPLHRPNSSSAMCPTKPPIMRKVNHLKP